MKNKEITIYELIGLIKDNKAPKKIKFDNEIFEYEKRHNYISQDGNLLFGDYIYELYYTPSTLNDTVEIIEENNDWEDTDVCRKDEFLRLTTDEKLLELFIDLKRINHNQKYLKDKVERKDGK